MASKMLIDTAHPEETRVVVMHGNKLGEFDFESANRKQLRGNIYLAKVTRVEPSLQAAFVDYGGNRHGFLAFSEIHPDYYQIPVADRQALIEQEAADDVAEREDDDVEDASSMGSNGAADDGDDEDGDDFPAPVEAGADSDDADAENGDNGANGAQDVEQVGEEDALAEVPKRRRERQRRYKIQEVIKRRQVILIQVVKEERGTKGAALTTYLSLAGRYCVLMPNTARGGGISRKITNLPDRRRLKDVAGGLNVPDGMGLIVRTAGAKRTKAEIKRDFEYLIRLWESVRDLTLKSSAPCLVYEEGSLIKRSIRDLYGKDVDEIIIDGEDGYKEAKAFMKMLMPSHAKNVKLYKEPSPLFMHHRIESQLDGMFQPRVTLKSGGYLIINQTEALVSIDVNSGKSTREHNIEDTALSTNLEAAEEAARQMRLRDLAGLIVIDFIDMEERRNNRHVERKLKEALKHDRARIQVGRISHFGLLEMSRQRMRAGVVEGSTQQCERCAGRGFVRSVESSALFVLRAIEEHILKSKSDNLVASVARDVALYILNQKRDHLLGIEQRNGITIFVEAGAGLVDTEVEFSRGPRTASKRRPGVQVDSAFIDAPDVDDGDDEDGDDDRDKDQERKPRRRRRRGRGRGRGRDGERDTDRDNDRDGERGEDRDDETKRDRAASDDGDGADDEKEGRRKRRRGGRGRRRRGGGDQPDQVQADDRQDADAATGREIERDDGAQESADRPDAGDDDKPRGGRGSARARGRRKPADTENAEAENTDETKVAAADADAGAVIADDADGESKTKPKRRRVKKVAKDEKAAGSADKAKAKKADKEDKDAKTEQDKPKRGRKAAKDADDPAGDDDKPKKRKSRAKPKAAKDGDGADDGKEAAKAKKAAPGNGADDAKSSKADGGADTPAEPPRPRRSGWWQRG